jgi:guanine deaminase
MKNKDEHFMKLAIKKAQEGMKALKGGPFGAVVVKDGVVIAEAYNEVTSSNDPTAHAEVLAIRRACKALGTFQLEGCDIYCSCEPCPMCLGAIYWSRPSRVIFSDTRKDACKAGFDDDVIYKELSLDYHKRRIKFKHLVHGTAKGVFGIWKKLTGKTPY